MNKIENLTESCFDTTKIVQDAPYILKKNGYCRLCTVVGVSSHTITVSYFNSDGKIVAEVLTPAIEFDLIICGDNIINIESEPINDDEYRHESFSFRKEE